MLGYQTIVLAMREGEISVIAPFRYMSLLWSITLGVVFFAETPDRWMLAGVAIIIGSGLYTFLPREQARPAGGRAARHSAAPLIAEDVLDARRPSHATFPPAVKHQHARRASRAEPGCPISRITNQ